MKRPNAPELDQEAFEFAVDAFLSEWEAYFGEDPRGPVADSVEQLLRPAIVEYLCNSR